MSQPSSNAAAPRFFSLSCSAFTAATAAVAAAASAIALVLVVSMRSVPRINNLQCHFLGLIAFFAIHQSPSLPLFAMLAGAAALGSAAAWAAHALQRRMH